MANLKSKEKRILTSRKEAGRNNSINSSMKTAIKNFEKKVADGGEVQKELNTAIKAIDKACSKGLIHKNTAGRKKSNIQRKAASLNK